MNEKKFFIISTMITIVIVGFAFYKIKMEDFQSKNQKILIAEVEENLKNEINDVTSDSIRYVTVTYFPEKKEFETDDATSFNDEFKGMAKLRLENKSENKLNNFKKKFKKKTQTEDDINEWNDYIKKINTISKNNPSLILVIPKLYSVANGEVLYDAQFPASEEEQLKIFQLKYYLKDIATLNVTEKNIAIHLSDSISKSIIDDLNNDNDSRANIFINKLSEISENISDYEFSLFIQGYKTPLAVYHKGMQKKSLREFKKENNFKQEIPYEL